MPAIQLTGVRGSHSRPSGTCALPTALFQKIRWPIRSQSLQGSLRAGSSHPALRLLLLPPWSAQWTARTEGNGFASRFLGDFSLSYPGILLIFLSRFWSERVCGRVSEFWRGKPVIRPIGREDLGRPRTSARLDVSTDGVDSADKPWPGRMVESVTSPRMT